MLTMYRYWAVYGKVYSMSGVMGNQVDPEATSERQRLAEDRNF